VRAYATKDPMFPVHPTSDQLYGGETFDAYQSLGRHVGEACATALLSPEDDRDEPDDDRPVRISIDAWPGPPLAGDASPGGVTDVRASRAPGGEAPRGDRRFNPSGREGP
jgi:hypothetical protein